MLSLNVRFGGVPRGRQDRQVETELVTAVSLVAGPSVPAIKNLDTRAEFLVVAAVALVTRVQAGVQQQRYPSTCGLNHDVRVFWLRVTRKADASAVSLSFRRGAPGARNVESAVGSASLVCCDYSGKRQIPVLFCSSCDIIAW